MSATEPQGGQSNVDKAKDIAGDVAGKAKDVGGAVGKQATGLFAKLKERFAKK